MKPERPESDIPSKTIRRRCTALLLLSSMAVFSLLSSCSIWKTAGDPFDPPDFVPTAAPSDWMILNPLHDYKEITPLAIEDIPASRIELPDLQYSEMIRPAADGGCIAISLMEVSASGSSGSQDSSSAGDAVENPEYHLQATRYKANGGIAWHKVYEAETFRGYPITMCIFEDGSFAASFDIALPSVSQSSSSDILYRFSSGGSLLWKTKADETDQGSLEYLFAAADGAVLAAGTIAAVGEDGTFSNSDISLMRFEMDGTLAKSVTLSMPQNDMLVDASFDAGAGLVISWRTEVTDDPALAEVAFNQVSQIECFNADLSKKWVIVMPADESPSEVILLPDGDGCLAFVSKITGQEVNGAVNTSYISELVRFTNTGSRLWTYSLEQPNAWIMAATQLDDGRIVGGWYWNTLEDNEESTLFILSSDGILENEVAVYPGVLRQIAATTESSFTVVLSQTVGGLPQPPYISSMWTDTEAIIAHFDSSLTLVWQRRIDQYKHALRTDIVIPCRKDNLLVG